MIRIQNGFLNTIECGTFEKGYVDIDENGKIVAFGDMKDAADFDGEIFDAEGGYILPGFIDAHSHLGISEEGFRWEGEDCNETTDPVTPDMRVVDGFYPFDTAIPKARKAGVTMVNVCPGSTNIFGGQTACIKLKKTANVEEMILKAPAAMKCALGENPKNSYGRNKSSMPMTRMASAAIFRRTMEEAKIYAAKKEDGEETYNSKYEALLPLLRGEIGIHMHAHRSDDILTGIRLAKEFDLKIVIIHATEGMKIVKELAEENITPILGPFVGPSGKPETNAGTPALAGVLEEAGVDSAITTDHDVFPLWLLPHFASIAVREGLSEEAGLRSITINAAKACGVEERTGSVKVGKDADIAVFTGHPFHYMSKIKALYIDGQRVE